MPVASSSCSLWRMCFSTQRHCWASTSTSYGLISRHASLASCPSIFACQRPEHCPWTGYYIVNCRQIIVPSPEINDYNVKLLFITLYCCVHVVYYLTLNYCFKSKNTQRHRPIVYHKIILWFCAVFVNSDDRLIVMCASCIRRLL